MVRRADPSKIIIPKSLIGAPLEEIPAWACSICLTFGTSVSTAYIVAGHFVDGIDRLRSGWETRGAPSAEPADR